MPRSVWKGPFVDGYLLKKAERPRAKAAARKSSRPGRAVRPFCRTSWASPSASTTARSTFPSHFRGHDRPQARRVRADPYLLRARCRQESEAEVRDGKRNQSSPRSGERSDGRVPDAAGQPQKLNLVAEQIRGKPVGKALNELTFSKKPDRRRREERRCSRRLPTPRTITASMSTVSSSPKPGSARTSP